MEAPYLRIVRGDATAEEVAALVAALTARGVVSKVQVTQSLESWRNPADLMRKPLTHGPGAWRRASQPIYR
ncbi:acyl-CoA carboxylase epsilon subunit [Sinosporangium album]|uniref:acyl-CoA carboxylase epsilon subunit n=1 Tax=Sinosporangium album TaxID=504805 RepID=UPI000B8740C3|nr:acyl-CoA carboxylase epsilon subunit [Sinosporangium album]